jgi:uncharacterized membrane protein YccC
MTLIDRLRRQANAARAQARLVARLLIAALLSYAAAQALHMPQSYWAAITALVIVQANVGATMGAGIDRIVGTLIGAVVGAAVAMGRYHGVSDLILLAIALIPLSILAAVRPTYRIAPITAVIALLAGGDLQAPWIPALHRVAEISLGTVIGILVSLVVLPSHAREMARAALARALAVEIELLHLYLVRLDSAPQGEINTLNDRLRNEIALAEKAQAETQHEPGSSADTLHSQIRAVRRLHSDIVFVGRVTQSWPRDATPPELLRKLDALEAALRPLLSALMRAAQPLEDSAAPGKIAAGKTAAVNADSAQLSLGAVDKCIGQLNQELSSGSGTAMREAALLPMIGQILRRDLAGLIDALGPARAEVH